MAPRTKSTVHPYLKIVGPRLRLLLSDEAISFRRAAEVLRDEHEVAVSEETLRRWAVDLGIPSRRPRSKSDDETERAAS